MKKIILSVAVIAIAATAIIGATRAYFSDTETSTGNTFTAGTLNIVLDPNGIINNDNPPTLPISLTNLYPGYDGAAKGDFYYPAVANDGSMPFNWDFSLVKTGGVLGLLGGDMNDVLKVKVYESASSPSFDPWAYPAGGTFNCQNAVIWDGSYPGATVRSIYDGNVSAYSSAVPMGSLTPGYGRCYRMSFYLDGAVGNEYQGASAVYTLGVDAAQIP